LTKITHIINEFYVYSIARITCSALHEPQLKDPTDTS